MQSNTLSTSLDDHEASKLNDDAQGWRDVVQGIFSVFSLFFRDLLTGQKQSSIVRRRLVDHPPLVHGDGDKQKEWQATMLVIVISDDEDKQILPLTRCLITWGPG